MTIVHAKREVGAAGPTFLESAMHYDISPLWSLDLGSRCRTLKLPLCAHANHMHCDLLPRYIYTHTPIGAAFHSATCSQPGTELPSADVCSVCFG